MKIFNTRQQLIDHALSKLGYPVLTINVAQDQIDNCVDDALAKYTTNHFDGYRFDVEVLPLVSGTDKYILSSDIFDVLDILRTGAAYTEGEPTFNAYWDFMQEKRYTGYLDLIGFRILMDRLKMTEIMFKPKFQYHFNCSTHQIQLFPTPAENANIALCVYRVNDPYDYADVYNDPWLRQYVEALIGEQWGTNLTKFTSVPLPGGSNLNGDGILERYTTMKKELEEELEGRFTLPAEPMIG